MSLLVKSTDVGGISGDVTTLLARLTAIRAGYLDHLNRDRPDMIFPSPAADAAAAIIVIPNAAGVTDINFPSVVVSGLPLGITIARADFVAVIGAIFDTSGAENQVAIAAKTIRVKKSTGNWAVAGDQMVALTFALNALQVDADAYRGGPPLFGATDIKAIVDGDATYNFCSEQTNNTEGVYATGANIELLDVSSIVRVWFN